MKVWCSWVLMVFSLVGNSQSFTGNTWEEVKSNKQGTIVLAYVETPALAYLTVSGKLSGICVDIMNDFVNYISLTENVKLDVKWVGQGTDFQGMYDKVRNSVGGVFGLGNITITDGRKKEIKFSPPFINNFAVLITNKKVPMIMHFQDLPRLFNQINAYTVRGTINDGRILNLKQKYFPALKIIYTDSSNEMLDRIAADPNGLGFIDVAFYLHAVKNLRSIRRHPVGDQAVEKFGFALPLNSDWQGVMDEFFRANGGYNKSPHYRSILTRHLGEIGVSLLQNELE